MSDLEQITGVLSEHLQSMPQRERELVLGHLRGGTSATWLSQTLSRHGYAVSATTLKEQRAKLRSVE